MQKTKTGGLLKIGSGEKDILRKAFGFGESKELYDEKVDWFDLKPYGDSIRLFFFCKTFGTINLIL